ncbi:hypothetical protein CAPTEDRAFT_220986, partial [Capitella teleta]
MMRLSCVLLASWCFGTFSALRSMNDERPCVRLAADLCALIDVQDSLSVASMKGYMKLMTNVDLWDFDEVRSLVCKFFESTEHFLDYIYFSGIQEFLVRRAYAFAVVDFGFLFDLALPGPEKEAVRMLFASGYADLDPVDIELFQ